MALSSKIVTTVRPDIVDINFGCPVKSGLQALAGVLKDVDLIRLTKAVINSTDLPVTVKTRLGWDDNSINIEGEELQRYRSCLLIIHASNALKCTKDILIGHTLPE
jgi:tRNA-dihydrouridine synthase